MVITELWGSVTLAFFTGNMLGHEAGGVVAQTVLHTDQGGLHAQWVTVVVVTDLVRVTH